MNNEPIYISVVLSTYNDEKYIAKSIQSILNQTYPFFEFIIVNDGSTDGTLNIIKSFKDHRIILIDKANTGLSDSLNIGIKKAKYDWIARMDGDDIAYPERLELQMKYINNNVAAIGGQVDFIDVNDNINAAKYEPTSSKLIHFCNAVGYSRIIHPTALINKSHFMSVKGYDLELFCAEDLDLWLRLGKLGKLINIPQKVLHYRINPNGVSRSKSELQDIRNMISLVKNRKELLLLTHEDYLVFESAIKKHKLYLKYKQIYARYSKTIGLKRRIALLKSMILKMIIIKTI